MPVLQAITCAPKMHKIVPFQVFFIKIFWGEPPDPPSISPEHIVLSWQPLFECCVQKVVAMVMYYVTVKAPLTVPLLW